MLLNLSDISDEPLQSQIASQIRAKILCGYLPANEPLPSIRALAREHRISVVTAQRGYEILEREELIYSRRGKGFFVSHLKGKKKKEMAVQLLSEALKPIINRAVEEGLSQEDILEAMTKILNNEVKHGKTICN